MLGWKPATKEAREAFLTLLWAEAGELLEAVQRLMGLDPEALKGFVHTVGTVYVLLHGEAEVGYLWIEKRQRVLHVHGIVMKDGFRGQGLGTSVFRSLEESYAGSVDTIELGVHRTNGRAERWYRSLGFATFAELEDLGFTVLQKPLPHTP